MLAPAPPRNFTAVAPSPVALWKAAVKRTWETCHSSAVVTVCETSLTAPQLPASSWARTAKYHADGSLLSASLQSSATPRASGPPTTTVSLVPRADGAGMASLWAMSVALQAASKVAASAIGRRL